ncbi:molybdate ABC transporter substrate-binding protein [Frigidibacter sp. RF13]|uniref:molybdate ABC transporter substrate-binding protein n=1 Tax=Frigidibacter sp. RF13 TaxID=2997340 RepID=UPI0022722148|nr:molybdate ABC transporter substrate-binding protein [Frigidibacter sp. RF13]MCY1127157.1 molybdate ABC transporter substrate-binding protein [Frigidibacter sp. RF13]
MIRLLLVVCLLLPSALRADTALIAVATNFAPVAEELAQAFAAETGDEIRITAGATGKLSAQIAAGAPFDAFLSADNATPARLLAEGLAVEGTARPYALGRLALWSADPVRDLSDPAAALRAARHVAIANPDLAPYGLAAMEVLDHLGLTGEVQPKLVTGENIGQAFSMVASKAADVGFIAASSLTAETGGSAWAIPAEDHAPLIQSAVLLAHGADNKAAAGFLAFLASPVAREMIGSAGYGLP